MLVIHPKDNTPDMLTVLYEGLEHIRIAQDCGSNRLSRILHHTPKAERVMLLGHGSDKGLYFRKNDDDGFYRTIVSHPQAYHLRRHGGNLVGIWCHAVDFARAVDARFILRGLRTVSDFEYERTIADTNQLIAGIETVILFTESAYSHVSSTVARDLISYGKDITEFLPPGVKIND